MKQGIDAAMAMPQPPDYLLLTDADIVHAPDSLRRLVARAQAGGLVLTSLMVKLRCESLAEHAVIPGLHLLLPDALSVRVGEPPGQHGGGRGRRLHAGARRCARQGGRHRDASATR